MALNISIRELSIILDSTIFNEDGLSENLRISQVATDSRSLGQRDVFVALRGENFDGHEFAQTAIERGAIALIVDHPLEISKDLTIPQLIVSDTLVAYQKIAQWWRNQFSIPIIGITGSVGKTTTKELIAAALSLHGKVHKTQANYNNEIGVPKTLLEITPDHDFAIIEMAMRGRGEIALLAQIAQPTIGVITNVGTAHIGRLGSEQAIAEAKCELLAEMPDSSMAILNQDNERLIKTASQVWSGQIVTYGLEGGDIHGKLIDFQTLEVENSIFPLPLPGRHNALNYLAVLAIAKVLGLDWESLTTGLTVDLPGGRARRYDLGNDILLLDETYNAGLESMLAALDLLQETPGKRRIAVIGAMKELGERSPEFHQRVGAKVKKLGLDYLFVLTNDPDVEYLVKGATGIETECFATHELLVKRLENFMTSGDRLLFKASNSVGLGKVVASLNKNSGE
jgi:UDP-N-acetylmuramoyl-tripeptide--D-alanyl-D-alanine ligase